MPQACSTDLFCRSAAFSCLATNPGPSEQVPATTSGSRALIDRQTHAFDGQPAPGAAARRRARPRTSPRGHCNHPGAQRATSPFPGKRPGQPFRREPQRWTTATPPPAPPAPRGPDAVRYQKTAPVPGFSLMPPLKSADKRSEGVSGGTARGQEVARNCGDAASATASTGTAGVSSWLDGCPSRAFCIPGPTSASPLPIRVKSRRRYRAPVRIGARGAV
jgi:hypothetical protein